MKAQPTTENYQKYAEDFLSFFDDLHQSYVDQMPTYNLKESDVKILIYKPKGFIYDMPVISQAVFLLRKIFHEFK